MKKILTVLFAVFFAAMFFSAKKAPALQPFNINIPYKKAVVKIVLTRKTKKEKNNSRAVIFKKGQNFRIEYKRAGIKKTDIFIYKDGVLNVINENAKTIIKMKAGSEKAGIFFDEVFINAGIAKKKPRIIGGEKIGRFKCVVIDYSMLKNNRGIYTKVMVTEWRDKKSKMLIKAKTSGGDSMFGNIVYPGFEETFEVKSLKRKWFMSNKLFKLPEEYKIYDVKKEAQEFKHLKAEKKTKTDR